MHGAARAVVAAHAGRPGADAAPGPAGRRGRGRAPDLPARRRAGAGQDGPGAARRGGGRTPTRCSSSCRTWSRRTGLREAGLWTPRRSATVIHGNGDSIDGFADIVIVNYEVLDRHVGWLGEFGLRGMVVDEAHFIKNKPPSARSTSWSSSERIRSSHRASAADGPHRHPADQRHRGLPGHLAVPRAGSTRRSRAPELMHALDETGLTPADPGFYAGRPPVRHRPRHRPSPQGRRGRRHPRAAHRRPPRRAGRAGRPVDPGRRARPRPPDGVAVRDRARPAGGPAPSSRASTTTSCARWPGGSRRTRPRRRPARTSSA